MDDTEKIRKASNNIILMNSTLCQFDDGLIDAERCKNVLITESAYVLETFDIDVRDGNAG